MDASWQEVSKRNQVWYRNTLRRRYPIALDTDCPSTMSQSGKLRAIRFVHTVIYLVMVAAITLLLVAGITGTDGMWLWVSLSLLTIESAVFTLYGFKCPLTSMAVRYGATTGHVFDTFLPEKFTRYTFWVFGSLTAGALLLLGARWAAG
jgi:hypothetical protein